MHKYSNVYSSEEPPKDKSVLWLHHETKNDLSSPRIAEIFNKGKWIPISLSDSSDSGDSSSAIQIVELNFDGSIPKTGTMSADDIAKLEGDDCFLVINGKYYYKSFESDSGIDYNEFKLTNILGGVRTIYFTVNKSTGAYTINYTYPVQANLEASGTLPELENIKVGNTVYRLPAAGSLVVYGHTDDNALFVPDEGEPTWAQAVEVFINGGSITLVSQVSINKQAYSRVVEKYPSAMDYASYLAYTLDGTNCSWEDPNFEQIAM